MRKFADRWREWRARLGVSLAVAMAASFLVGTSALAENNNNGDNNGCNPTGTGQPCVVGEGTQLQFGTTPPPNGFAVSARGTGPEAHGFFSFTLPFGPEGNTDEDEDFVARVTCLIVVGNDAIATGIFTQPESAEGQRVVMEAVDNGGAATDLLRFSFTGFIAADLTADPNGNCWRPSLGPVAIQTGHIAVGRTDSDNGD